MPSSFTIDELGGRIATVWSELRPATRGLVERALQAAATGTPNNTQFSIRRPGRPRTQPFPRRARRSRSPRKLEHISTPKPAGNSRSIADTTASVLQEQTESAEVFAQLVRRAEMQRDYKRIDTLADALTSRFPPSEICELARSEDTIVRELANEALARCPVSLLIGLLNDPVDAETARSALRTASG